MRILRIENNDDSAGAVIEIKNSLPGFAAVARAENTALGVRAVGVAKSSDEGDIGIGGMDNDGADVAGGFQTPNVSRFSALLLTKNAIPQGDVVAGARFAPAPPEDNPIRI